MESLKDKSDGFLGSYSKGREVSFRGDCDTYYLNIIQQALDDFLIQRGFKALEPGHVYTYATCRKFTAWERSKSPRFDLFEVNRWFSVPYMYFLFDVVKSCLQYSMGGSLRAYEIGWKVNSQTGQFSRPRIKVPDFSEGDLILSVSQGSGSYPFVEIKRVGWDETVLAEQARLWVVRKHDEGRGGAGASKGQA